MWHSEDPRNGGCVYTEDTVNWTQGVCCADALHPSVVDGSCTVCVGDRPEDCLHATCEEGFIPNSLGRVTPGECVSCATVDLSAWPQILNGSCTSCTGKWNDLYSGCTSYSCAVGYHNQTRDDPDLSPWSCQPPPCHTIDFSSVPSVVDGSCHACPWSPPLGRQPTDCSFAECEVGYKSFKDGRCSVDPGRMIVAYLKFVIPAVILLLVPCIVVCCVKKRRATKSSGESELETSLHVSSTV